MALSVLDNILRRFVVFSFVSYGFGMSLCRRYGSHNATCNTNASNPNLRI
nr:MAG TPA: hypothetical protein [Caudoviricetes sp.]